MIAGSYGNSIFSLLRKLHIVLHSGCSSLHSHQLCNKQPLLCWGINFIFVTCSFHCVHLSLGLPGGASGKRNHLSMQETRDSGSIPGLGRSSGGGHGNLLQRSCLENPRGQMSLAGYSPWGRKESDVTEATEHTRKGSLTELVAVIIRMLG